MIKVEYFEYAYQLANFLGGKEVEIISVIPCPKGLSILLVYKDL